MSQQSQQNQNQQNQKGPVGTLKKIVSLIDRGAFDTLVYPQTADKTVFQPTFKPYHNFTHNVVTWGFTGVAEWGKRITFEVPRPWEADMMSWVALRLKPLHWLSPDVYQHLYETRDWVFKNAEDEWIWTESLGTAAIAKAELEVDGVVIEQWSGDWCDVWTRAALDVNKGVGWDDSVVGPLGSTEDGYTYCYLPFWFAKWRNTSFPLLSCTGPVRIHITLRPFNEVVRRRVGTKTCDETPLGTSFQVRDLSVPFYKLRTVPISARIPTMEAADIVCGIAHIDGELRTAFREAPHEMIVHPVQEIRFAEPLKYVVGVPTGDTIHIGLPLREANGPIRQIFWFLRRKDAVEAQADWTNYSATLQAEEDPVWEPRRPLLRRAQLMAGTAVWADQEEKWWRSTGALPLEGGIRVYGNYIYAYNFTEKPNSFEPAGSLNASRVDLRLNLEVEQPAGTEWEVVVFLVSTNWIRFQNGLANMLFMD